MDEPPAPLSPNELRISIEAQQAAVKEISRCTNAFLEYEKDEPEVSTGVFISVNGRLFVATTSHSGRKFKKLSLVSKDLRQVAQSVPIVTKYQESRELDIAYLEIDPEVARDLCLTPIGLDRIDTNPPVTKRLVFVVGYPSSKVKWKQGGPKNYDLQFQGVGYAHRLVEEGKLPEGWTDGLERPLVPGSELFLPYDLDEELFKFPGQQGGDILSHPGGTSGGGWWQGEDCSSQLWYPERVKLVGLQTSFHKKMIRATRIACWLRLLFENEPDLQDALRERFDF